MKEHISNIENETHNKVRPLGIISDFVVEELPRLVEAVKQGKKTAQHISNDAEMVCSGHKSIIKFDADVFEATGLLELYKVEATKQIAKLDMRILCATIHNLGAQVGVRTGSLYIFLASACGERATTKLTPADVVLNPIGDKRFIDPNLIEERE